MIYNVSPIILFVVNALVIYLTVVMVTIADWLYTFNISINDKNTVITTGPFYITYGDEETKPIKCKNLEPKDSPTYEFGKSLSSYCISIKVFTVINLVGLALITFFPILKFLGKKAELYVLGGLILSFLINIALVGGVYHMIKKTYIKTEIESESIIRLNSSSLDTGFLVMVGIMVFYALMFGFRLYKYHNCKIVCKKL